MKYIQPRRLDIQNNDQVMDIDNHITIGDFETVNLQPRERHENAFLFLEAHRMYQYFKLTPEELALRYKAAESMLKQCLNAITGCDPFEDQRGIVYKQEFGIAFVKKIEEVLAGKVSLITIADKSPEL